VLQCLAVGVVQRIIDSTMRTFLCVAVCYSVLQHTATPKPCVLQCVTVCCSVLQCVAIRVVEGIITLKRRIFLCVACVAACYSVLQCVAIRVENYQFYTENMSVRCSDVLQCDAVCRIGVVVLQCVVVCCSAL